MDNFRASLVRGYKRMPITEPDPAIAIAVQDKALGIGLFSIFQENALTN